VPALSVKSLHKSYGQLHAVNGVSFEVVRGDVFALLGPNGAGKSTTIEILEGFLKRDGGEVSVLGVDPGERSEQRWLRTRIGVVLQELTVEPFFSVRQVLERNAGYYPSPRAVDEVIELVGLRDKADVKVKNFRGPAAPTRYWPRNRWKPRVALSRRADDRTRPRSEANDVGVDSCALVPGHHGRTFEPLHGRGRGTR